MTHNTQSINIRIGVVSFFSGFSIMLLEFSGSRIVAPFFGTSIIVWTALIGVIMASLSLGNWLGGLMADKRPQAKLLGRILISSALITALTAFFASSLLSSLEALHLNLYISSVYAALAVFSPSSFLLGMVSPFLARLSMHALSSSGSVVGKLSALNSAGSIAGTFMGGFVLVSLFPADFIMMIAACINALLAILVYTGAWRRLFLFLFFLLNGIVFAAYFTGFFLPHKFLVGKQIDTPYSHLTIAESIDTRNGRRLRILITQPGTAQSLTYIDDPCELVSPYTKFYDLAFCYNPDVKRILMLGGGGYSVPKHIISSRPDVSIDVVELDPGVTETARKYFFLEDSPNMRIFHEDARTFLNRAAYDKIEPYDAVFMDTFNSAVVIPFQLTTAETGAKIHSLLKPGGILIANIISSVYGSKSGVFHGIYKAFSQSFNTMMIFPVNAPEPKYARALQNIMLVAGDFVPNAALSNDEYSELLSHQWLEPFTPSAQVPVFTDKFAPVERYTLVQ